MTRRISLQQDPLVVASPLARDSYGIWRVPPGIQHYPQAWEGTAQHRAPPTSFSVGRDEPPVPITMGRRPPFLLSLVEACWGCE